jgi:fatty-acyl-CoA synthase
MVSERVTAAFGVPTFWNDVLQAIDREPSRWTFHPGTRLYVGGAPPPAEMFRRFDRLGVYVQTGWGMTECSPIGSQTWLRPEYDGADDETRIAIRASNGLPLPFIEMRHVDDQGRPQPWDATARGELQVRGPWVTAAYVGWPEPLSATTDDGWLRTADIVTIAPDGYLKLVDRLKDLVKSGGEWISSVEMEGLLMEHRDVFEAAVIAVPDARWGKRPLAIVAPKPGATEDAGAIRDFLATRMPKWMVPEQIVFVPTLPKTGAGKLDKVALRRRFAAPA